jgi:hypothetical protein
LPDLNHVGITYKTVTTGYTGAITGDTTGYTVYTVYIGDTGGVVTAVSTAGEGV